VAGIKLVTGSRNVTRMPTSGI